MIEVLITLLIIAFGVLAVVALQALSKRNNLDSVSQTIAAQSAYDIIERMRANSSSAGLDSYINNAPNNAGGFLADEPTPDCINDPCTDADALARHDVWAWGQGLQGASEQVVTGGTAVSTGGLVNPTACIVGPTGGGSGIYAVTIVWRAGNSLNQIASTDPGYVACGAGALDAASKPLYGPGDIFRRTMTVQAYIAVR